MKDGTRRDSIKGMTVPVTDITKAAYKVVADYSIKQQREVAV
jgi:hypothetical protein